MTDYKCSPELASKLENLTLAPGEESEALKDHLAWIMTLSLKPGDRVQIPDLPGWKWYVFEPPVN